MDVRTIANPQPDLFNQVHLRPTPRPSTSRLAYGRAERGRPSRYARILELLAERGTITCAEAAEAIGVPMHKISGRFTELSAGVEWDGKKVRIERTGERRRNRDGNLCDVYRRIE